MAIVDEIPRSNRPIDEQLYIAHRHWVKLDSEARKVEDLKSTILEQKKQDLIRRDGDMPDSHAERRIKASHEWEQYVIGCCDARTEANYARAEWDRLERAYFAEKGKEANERLQMRLR